MMRQRRKTEAIATPVHTIMTQKSKIVTCLVAKRQRREGRTGQAEIGLGKRGAIVVRTTITLQAKVAKVIGVYRHTVA